MLRRLFWFGFFSFLLILIFTVIAIYFVAQKPLPTLSGSNQMVLLDANGDVLAVQGEAEQFGRLTLQQISPFLIQATIAIEDRRFYQHYGFDLKGIGRALMVNVKEQKKVQGASTLTQQLARNLFLSHEKTWSRKLREAEYTLRMEQQWSKDEILRRYLNHIYYGHACYGVESAARHFFDKDAANLTLAESAMLAGIPKGPKYYSPLINFKQAKKRQQLVLKAMVLTGKISRVQSERAFAERLTFRKGDAVKRTQFAPYFRDYVLHHALEQTGLSLANLQKGGLQVKTTLDARMQQVAESTIQSKLAGYPDLQVSLLALNPHTGDIQAMVGGRDYQQNQFNRVLSVNRQPGSAFKPMVYLSALLNGATAISKQRSEPEVFTFDDGKKTYTPKNFANHYAYDWIDMRRAIAQSDNIYAVKTMMEVGPQTVIDLCRKLGITTTMQPLPSLALGSFPVRPLEITAAYAAIADQGIYNQPSAISEIRTHDGKQIYRSNQQESRVFSAAHAFVLTKLMESVFEQGGTGYRVAHLIKRPVAGKTGTTNTDAWMIGYTPSLVVSVWIGHDQGKQITSSEAYLAAPIFANFIEQVSSTVIQEPPKMFELDYDNVVSVYIDEQSGKLADGSCPQQRLEHFVRGTEPRQFCSAPKLEPVKPVQPEPIPLVEEQNQPWLQQFQDWLLE